MENLEQGKSIKALDVRQSTSKISKWMDKGVLEWLNVLNWLVYLNGWVFVYKLNGCGFDSRCSHWSKIKLEETPCVFFAKLYWNYSSSVVFYYFSIGLVLGELWGTFYRKVFKSISGSLMFFW